MTLKFGTRRDFISLLGMSAAGAAFASLLKPSIAYAVPGPVGPSNIEIYIKIFLNGGMDGLSLLPPRDLTYFNVLKTQRPTLMNSSYLNSPSQVLDLGQAYGLHWMLGPNCPASNWNTGENSTISGLGLKSIYELLVQGDGKVLPQIGFPVPNLDHPTAVDPWNIGNVAVDRASSLHWEARLMQQGGYSWNQMWLLGHPGGMIPFRAAPGQTTPISTQFLSQINRFKATVGGGWNQGAELGDNVEIQAAQSAIEQIMQLPDDSNAPITVKRYKARMRETLSTIDSVSPIINVALPNYFTNYQYPDGFDTSLADIAKVIYYHRIAQGQRVKLLFHLGFNGFDTHGQEGSTQDDILMPRFTALNHGIGSLHKFLSANGLWDKTAIQLVSEFGRAVVQDPRGTAHGHASNLLMLGGAVSQSGGPIQGGSTLLPTISELASPPVVGGSTILTAKIDPRDILWEIIEGLGEDPAAILAGYTRTHAQNLFA